MSTLVEKIAAMENDEPVEEVSPMERKRIYTALHQSHIPLLEERGVITVNEETGDVSLTPAARRVGLYLEDVPEGQISWSVYFLGLSVLSLAFLIVTANGVVPFGRIRMSHVFWLIVFAFLASALVYYSRLRRTDLLP